MQFQFLSHNRAKLLPQLTLPPVVCIQDLEKPEAEGPLGSAAAEGPLLRLLLPAAEAEADASEIGSITAAPAASEGSEEGLKAVDEGKS